MKRLSSVVSTASVALLLAASGCTAEIGTVGHGNVSGGTNAGIGGNAGMGSMPGAGGAGPGAGAGANTGAGGPAGIGGSGGSGTVADPTAAGVKPLRLLNAREYLNTVRDLLGDTTTLTAAGLPDGDEDRQASPLFAFRVDHAIATQDGNLLQSAAEALARTAVPRLATILPCAAPPAASAEMTCLTTFMTTFMPKMFRRPLAAAAVTRLTALYQVGRSTLALGFNDAIGLLIEASLQSPAFLYHWELDPGAAVREGAVVKLGNYELANRLSYLLWGSMPDDMLFAAAAAGQLADVAAVDTQVRRMLRDQKAVSSFVDFFTDWLDIDALPDMSKDANVYPMYNDALVTAMASEIQSLVTGIVMNGTGHLSDLLTGTSSYANQALASLYGVPGVTGTALRTVMLNPAQRSGLLTTAAFLATTGDAAESNPPRRGKAIYTKLLCGQLNPLPAVVPPPAPASQGGTLRQRMEQHDMNACTTGCHNIIEPFGFAFEEYGGVGEFRTTDNGLPVDSSGTAVIDGQSHTFKDAPGLVAVLAASPTVQNCFTTQWLRYAFGRFETDADQASIDAAATAFRSSTGDIRELLVGLSTSRTFRYRAPSAGEVLP